MSKKTASHLPLLKAYPFGDEHGLKDKMKRIRELAIKWERSETSSVRRGYVVTEFEKSGMFEAFMKRHWHDGTTTQGVARRRTYLELKRKWENR